MLQAYLAFPPVSHWSWPAALCTGHPCTGNHLLVTRFCSHFEAILKPAFMFHIDELGDNDFTIIFGFLNINLNDTICCTFHILWKALAGVRKHNRLVDNKHIDLPWYGNSSFITNWWWDMACNLGGDKNWNDSSDETESGEDGGAAQCCDDECNDDGCTLYSSRSLLCLLIGSSHNLTYFLWTCLLNGLPFMP